MLNALRSSVSLKYHANQSMDNKKSITNKQTHKKYPIKKKLGKSSSLVKNGVFEQKGRS